ncbi:MAG: ATP-binding protein [Myxococcota bacterium]
MAPSRGRLIIVDDEPVILSLLTTVFADDQDLDIVSCDTGQRAIDAMTDGVDVLLTDKNLPDVSGLEVARHARDHHPDVEIIIITGYASLDTALLAMELDVYDYIVKPPKDIRDVRRKVLQAFDKQAMRRHNRELMSSLKERNHELEVALNELREVQAELIQSEKLAGIGTLAAGIAHEISSPLFGVMGLAEAILDEDDLSLVHGYAKEIVDYSQSIKDIVVQLSGYSRTSGSDGATAVDLGQVVSDAVKLVVLSAGFDETRIVLDLPAELTVRGRASELQQVFVNLVKNAVEAVVEHSPNGEGQIRIGGERRGPEVVATVSDTGPGIDPSKISVIFDPFFTTKPAGRGTGLGLNIVYRIVTKYEGQISVASEPGQGATFTLRFPADGGS